LLPHANISKFFVRMKAWLTPTATWTTGEGTEKVKGRVKEEGERIDSSWLEWDPQDTSFPSEVTKIALFECPEKLRHKFIGTPKKHVWMLAQGDGNINTKLLSWSHWSPRTSIL
jgi:hypothetical protein